MTGSTASSRLKAIAAGVVYGVALRLLMDLEFHAFSGLMSLSFFALVPAAIGFIVVYIDPASATRSPARDLVAPAIAMVAFLLTTMILMLEGSICVLIALPWFLAFASAGGLIAGWLRRRLLLGGRTLSVVLMLPVVVSPIEAHLPTMDSHLHRQDSILIQAPPEVVWSRITNVAEIDSDELRFGLTRLLGVPRPVTATMDYSGRLPVRETRWDKGVYFAEEIIRFEASEAMQWRFVFFEDSVPPGVLDEHVQIGGKYFDLDEGGYVLERLADGSTMLTLSTSYRVSSRPGLYTKLWADWVMRDFHRMILELIRDRSEEEQGTQAHASTYSHAH